MWTSGDCHVLDAGIARVESGGYPPSSRWGDVKAGFGVCLYVLKVRFVEINVVVTVFFFISVSGRWYWFCKCITRVM